MSIMYVDCRTAAAKKAGSALTRVAERERETGDSTLITVTCQRVERLESAVSREKR